MRKQANSLARLIFSEDVNEEKIELYSFAIYIVFSELLHIVTMLLIGLIFGLVAESIILYISFISIRKFAGGYHAKTPFRCYLFSIVTIVISLLTLKFSFNSQIIGLNYMFISIALISLIVILFLSPLDNENKIINCKEKKVYKKISVVNSCVLFIISLFMLYSSNSYGYSVILGICISAIVLIVRKAQIVKGKI